MSSWYASFCTDHLLPGAHTSRSAQSSSNCSSARTAFLNASMGTWVDVTGAVRSFNGRTSNELNSSVPLSEKSEETWKEFMSNRGLSYNGRSVVEIRPRNKAQHAEKNAGRKHTSGTQSVHAMSQHAERPWHNIGLAQPSFLGSAPSLCRSKNPTWTWWARAWVRPCTAATWMARPRSSSSTTHFGRP